MSSEDRLQALRDRADSTKQYLENKYSMMRRHREERMRRKLSLEEQMERLQLSAEEREGLREELKKKELQLMRDARQRTSPADFEPLVLVGRGAFGEVRLVRHRETGKVFAMKTMAKHAMVLKNQVAHVRAERDLLAAADSSWVVRLHYSFQDASNLYMAMEYCPCGDLMGLLMREDVFSEDATRFYAAEAVLAIQSVHDLGYIHRDLKPDNILIDWDGHIKLTDLGLCKKVDAGLTEQAFGADREDLEATAAASAAGKRGPREPPAHGGRATHRTRRLAYTTVGTPDYIAPEVLLHRGYGKSCDWWSLGVILYECLVGYTPFFADDPPSTCRNIMRWRETLVFPPDALARLSKHAVDFVRRLVCDPADRLGAGGVEEIKAHPWFRGLDWGAVRKQTPPFEFEAGQRMEELMRTLGPLPATDPRFKAALTKLTENFDDFPDAPWPMRATGASRMPSHRDPAFVGYTFKRVPINNAVRVSAGVGSPRAALHLTAARRPVTIGGTTVGPGFGTIDAFDPAKVQRSSNASPGKSSRSSSAKPSPSKGRGDGSGDDDDDDDDPIFI